MEDDLIEQMKRDFGLALPKTETTKAVTIGSSRYTFTLRKSDRREDATWVTIHTTFYANGVAGDIANFDQMGVAQMALSVAAINGQPTWKVMEYLGFGTLTDEDRRKISDPYNLPRDLHGKVSEWTLRFLNSGPAELCTFLLEEYKRLFPGGVSWIRAETYPFKCSSGDCMFILELNEDQAKALKERIQRAGGPVCPKCGEGMAPPKGEEADNTDSPLGRLFSSGSPTTPS